HRARTARDLRTLRPPRRRAHRTHHSRTRSRRHLHDDDRPDRLSPGSRLGVDACEGSVSAMTAAVSKMAAAEWTKFRDLPRSRQLLVITFAAAAATAVVLVLTFPATRGTALSAATA